MATTLQGAIQEVAKARKLYTEINERLAEKGRIFEQENAELVGRAAELRKAVDAAETSTKAIALAHYLETKEQKPCAGVEIKLFSTLQYDSEEALAWAKEKQMALLPESLDKKAFEKIAKATATGIAYEILEPRVQIASDLGKVLDTFCPCGNPRLPHLEICAQCA